MRARCLSMTVTIACLSLSCASMMKDPEEPILITSTPSGAKVRLDGAYVGTTPVSITRKAADFNLVLEREDCAPFSSQVKATTDGGAVAASVASGILLIGVFEAISLADGGSSLYSDLPDVVNIPLACDDAMADESAAEPISSTP